MEVIPQSCKSRSICVGLENLRQIWTMARHSKQDVTVELTKHDTAGSAWLVRVYRRGFFGKKLVSSDWFLDEQQARRFSEQLTRELGSAKAIENLRSRPPGWTLHRPSH